MNTIIFMENTLKHSIADIVKDLARRGYVEDNNVEKLTETIYEKLVEAGYVTSYN